jgi:hypothetical protein
VRRVRRRPYDRLKELRFDVLSADVGEFLSPDEIRDWLATRDGIVAAIEDEARKRDVFFTPQEIAFEARVRIGRTARRRELADFLRRAGRLGARVERLPAGHPRLDGAHARTLLGPTGIRVLLGPEPGALALVEELEHVRQLRRLSRRAGGYPELCRFFNQEIADARLLGASMEARAKGKAAVAARARPDRRRAQAATRQHARAQNGAPVPSWARRALDPPPLGSRGPRLRLTAGRRR